MKLSKKEQLYEHRQYVILSAVMGLFILAYSFNRYVLSRSALLINVPVVQPFTFTLDNQSVETEQLDEDTYRLISTPGTHTLTIATEDSINHKQLVELKAGRTAEITPALTVAPDPASKAIGSTNYASQSGDFENLYYLGDNGHTLVRYNLLTDKKTALSDPVFRDLSQLNWSFDHQAVIVQDLKRAWYIFDFRKPDFVHSQFTLIGDPLIVDIKFDPAHDRVGYIEFREDQPIFGVASTGMQNKEVLTILETLRSPQFFWSPSGSKIAVIDDPRYNRNNLFLYDLATDALKVIPNITDVTRTVFSPDNRYLLAESSSTPGETGLYVYDLQEQTTKKVATLAQPGGAVWHHDSQAITAYILDTNQVTVLAQIKIPSMTTTNYRVSPQVSHPFSGLFLSSDSDTLYFISDEHLYVFPLKL